MSETVHTDVPPAPTPRHCPAPTTIYRAPQVNLAGNASEGGPSAVADALPSAPPAPAIYTASQLQCAHIFNVVCAADPISHFLAPIIKPSAAGPVISAVLDAPELPTPSGVAAAGASTKAAPPRQLRQLSYLRLLLPSGPLSDVITTARAADAREEIDAAAGAVELLTDALRPSGPCRVLVLRRGRRVRPAAAARSLGGGGGTSVVRHQPDTAGRPPSEGARRTRARGARRGCREGRHAWRWGGSCTPPPC